MIAATTSNRITTCAGERPAAPGARQGAGVRWFALAAALAAVTGAGCTEKAPPDREVIRPVRTQKIVAVGGGRVRRFSGVVRSGQEPRLSFKVAGTVRRLAVKVGDRVKRGQLIAELDPKDLNLAVQQARAAHAQARAQMVNAKATYARTRKLYETNSAARSNLDAARAAWESSRAAVASAAKQVQMARSKLSDTRLTSPIDGAISSCAVEVNENVAAGQPVVVLHGGGAPEVKITVPGVLIAQIKQGAAATVTIDALKGKSIPAKVSEVGVASESMGTTYPVTLALDGAPAAVRPGMAAEVAFELGDAGARARVVVPPVAVGQDREGRFAFVARPTGGKLAVIERRAVQVGELTSRGLEVRSGLSDGDRLVTAGVSQIRAGLKVKLMGEASP